MGVLPSRAGASWLHSLAQARLVALELALPARQTLAMAALPSTLLGTLSDAALQNHRTMNNHTLFLRRGSKISLPLTDGHDRAAARGELVWSSEEAETTFTVEDDFQFKQEEVSSGYLL